MAKINPLPTNPPPPGWGKDHLSIFFEGARNNSFAAIHHFPEYYQLMVKIDDVFEDLFLEYRDPEDMLGAGLAMRAHSAILAAAQLAVSGQVPESVMLLRGALESAMYAYHASSSDERAQIWLRRDEDEDTKKKCRNEYTPRAMFPVLRTASIQIGDVVGELYERLIDYGAHPNAKGVLTTMTVAEGDEDSEFSFAYLSGDLTSITFILRTWCQIAIATLDLLSLTLPERFKELGLEPQIDKLRIGL